MAGRIVPYSNKELICPRTPDATPSAGGLRLAEAGKKDALCGRQAAILSELQRLADRRSGGGTHQSLMTILKNSTQKRTTTVFTLFNLSRYCGHYIIKLVDLQYLCQIPQYLVKNR